MVYTGLTTFHLIWSCIALSQGMILILPVCISRDCDSRRIRAELKRNPSSCRLEKAECLEVKWKYVEWDDNGKKKRSEWFEGTFVAGNGVRYKAGQPSRGGVIDSTNESKMLAVLFSSTNLRPLADPRVAESCETSEGLRTECDLLIYRAKKVRGATANEARTHPASGDFDCLLFLGGIHGGADDATQDPRMVRT